MLEAIVFDYGKVLTMPPSDADWARLAAVFDASVEDFQKQYWGWRDLYDRAKFNAETYWTAVAQQLGKKLTAAGVEHLTMLDNTQWTVPRAEMLELAWRAQAASVKIGILSNMQFDMLKEMRRKFPWLDRFDAQIYTCEIGVVKPEPESYETTLRELGTSAQHALFFDDKQVNIDGARAVGMHAMLFTGDIKSAYRAAEELGAPLAAGKSAD